MSVALPPSPQTGGTTHLRYDPSNVCGMWNGSMWGHFAGPSPESLIRRGGGLGNRLGGPSPPELQWIPGPVRRR